MRMRTAHARVAFSGCFAEVVCRGCCDGKEDPRVGFCAVAVVRRADSNGAAASQQEAKPQEGAAEQEASLPFQSPPSHVFVLYGNVLYDWSQVRAWRLGGGRTSGRTAGARQPPRLVFNSCRTHACVPPAQVLAATGALPWRPVLDAAAVKFRASGAPEADVRSALKNHTRASELDLGPDPEPEVRRQRQFGGVSIIRP